jgi:hypothetical protein
MFRGILSENARKWSSRARVELYRYLAKDTGLGCLFIVNFFVTLCTMASDECFAAFFPKTRENGGVIS